MIESNIIKRYIVKTFMQYGRLGIDEAAEVIMSALNAKFFLHESVLILSSQQPGKISHCSRDTYRIVTGADQEIEVAFGDLQRRSAVRYDDVVNFLDCVTKQTAFGRILIENVFEKISQPNFGEISKSSRCGLSSDLDGKNISRDFVAGHSTGGQQLGFIDENSTQKGPFGNQTAQFHDKARPESNSTEHTQNKPQAKKHREDKEPAELKKGAQKPKYDKLNLFNLSRFTVKNFEGESLTGLVKIHMFLFNFREDFGFQNVDINSLAEAIHDPDYSSEIAFNIHSVFVCIVESEAKARKDRFFESLDFILDRLRPLDSECPVQTAKKRAAMTMENWKAQTRTFIQNFSRELDDDRIQQFYNFHKRDSFGVRISFLIFLIDVVTVTDRFRDVVSSKQNTLRAEKAKHDELCTLRKKKRDEDRAQIEQLAADLRDYDSFMVNHPLKVHLGRYTSYSAFVMDCKPILRDGNNFYILEKKDITAILRDLNPQAKSDKHLAINLKACAEALFKQ